MGLFYNNNRMSAFIYYLLSIIHPSIYLLYLYLYLLCIYLLSISSTELIWLLECIHNYAKQRLHSKLFLELQRASFDGIGSIVTLHNQPLHLKQPFQPNDLLFDLFYINKSNYVFSQWLIRSRMSIVYNCDYWREYRGDNQWIGNKRNNNQSFIHNYYRNQKEHNIITIIKSNYKWVVLESPIPCSSLPANKFHL